MSYNAEKFNEILKECIGTGSQTEFANKCGLSREHVNRMLKAEAPAPSRNTLRKIASAYSDVTSYEELLAACGYADSPAALRKEKPFTERALLNAEDLKNGLKALTNNVRTYSSISEFLSTYEMLYSHEDIVKITCTSPKEYEGNGHIGAEMYSVVKLKFESRSEECFTWFVLYFAETKGGNVVYIDYAMDGESLMEAGLTKIDPNLFKDINPDELRAQEFVYTTKFKTEAAERLLKALFGDDEKEETYLTAATGFGFYLDKVPDNFREFLVNHKKAICKTNEEKELYKLALESEHPEDAFLDYEDHITWETGFGAVISNVMQEETNLPFALYKDDADVPSECIMLEGTLDMDGKYHDDTHQLEEVKEIVNKYAKEIGVEEYGAVYVTVKAAFQKEFVYKVK